MHDRSAGGGRRQILRMRAPESYARRFTRGFQLASVGRSAWTAPHAARCRQSFFGPRVAVGVHGRGLRLGGKTGQRTGVERVVEGKQPDSARAWGRCGRCSTTAWSSRCCEAPGCAVGSARTKAAAKIQKEGRCEEDQPSRAQRKQRVHWKCIKNRYAARQRRATIPTSTPSISR